MVKFILASQSPRRKALLHLLNMPFDAIPAHADEDSIAITDPKLNVQETAVLKADIITNNRQSRDDVREILIAADTTVAFAGEMLNKPKDEADANRMLSMMSGQQHEVHTGYVIRDLSNGKTVVNASTAVVTMRNYSQQEILDYIATGDPMDKAGAYAIQHPEFRPVAQLDGCFLNVMGLPLCALMIALQSFDIEVNVSETAVYQEHQKYLCPIFPTLTF